MRLQTFTCDVPSCDNSFTESKPNQGAPGWGSISGVYDKDTGADMAYLCPECKQKVLKLLRGE